MFISRVCRYLKRCGRMEGCLEFLLLNEDGIRVYEVGEWEGGHLCLCFGMREMGSSRVSGNRGNLFLEVDEIGVHRWTLVIKHSDEFFVSRHACCRRDETEVKPKPLWQLFFVTLYP